MKLKLALSAFVKFICGIVLVGIPVFLPAGTFDFFGGWLLLIALLFVPMLVLGVALFFKAPDLLEKRLDTKEKQTSQKSVVGFSALSVILFTRQP